MQDFLKNWLKTSILLGFMVLVMAVFSGIIIGVLGSITYLLVHGHVIFALIFGCVVVSLVATPPIVAVVVAKIGDILDKLYRRLS